jgi:hypothetical protein
MYNFTPSRTIDMFTNAPQLISALALLMAAQLSDVAWPRLTEIASAEAKCTSSAHRHLVVRKVNPAARKDVARPARGGDVQILSFGP